MLTSLHIQNFKAWQDTGKLRLAPITVFFGSNSSGKSSLSQFLLMLKQTVQSPDRYRVLLPGDKKTPIDLGTYDDLIFSHSRSNHILFEINWALPDKLTFKDARSGTSYSGVAIKFEANISLEEKPRTDPVIVSMNYHLLNESKIEIGMKMLDQPRIKYEITSNNYNLVRKQMRVWQLPSPIRFYGFPDEVTAYFQNADFVRDLAFQFETLMQHLYYLGPLREYPQRLYTWSGEKPEHVGWRGEKSIEAILASQDRRLNSGPKKKYLSFEHMIARWLQVLGLIDSFEIKQIHGRRDYEVLVQTSGVENKVNLPDVGFGVSQLLPVIVQCFYAPPNSTIILEQPEIHLHPSVQAALADLFIEVIHAREEGENRNIQLLIESHSEHFLRRLQRRVAEQTISPEQIAVYFCRQTKQGSKIDPLSLDLYGNITNWPENFFGDEIGDLAAMTEAALQRKASKN